MCVSASQPGFADRSMWNSSCGYPRGLSPVLHPGLLPKAISPEKIFLKIPACVNRQSPLSVLLEAGRRRCCHAHVIAHVQPVKVSSQSSWLVIDVPVGWDLSWAVGWKTCTGPLLVVSSPGASLDFLKIWQLCSRTLILLQGPSAWGSSALFCPPPPCPTRLS